VPARYDSGTMPDIDAALDRVPGKIVAVHASYRSRAAERGTMPAWPSYFLKPASSLAASGDPVARPPGCELLAFEGEVALVIGRRACRVRPDDGWDHVSHLTAANDFGVYISTNGGQQWSVLGGNLPSIEVSDLQIQPRDNLIVIATYGRGMWVMDANKVRAVR